MSSALMSRTMSWVIIGAAWKQANDGETAPQPLYIIKYIHNCSVISCSVTSALPTASSRSSCQSKLSLVMYVADVQKGTSRKRFLEAPAFCSLRLCEYSEECTTKWNSNISAIRKQSWVMSRTAHLILS